MFMAQGVHRITEEFENKVSEYTGAKYVVAIDNQSNALFLALMYEKINGQLITIPSRTYPSVPCEIIHAGGKVNFEPVSENTIRGAKEHSEYEFILPIHPNPDVQKHKHLLTHINVINPLPYDEMLNLLVKTRLVITDSGGLQEECSFFNKKCLTCRVVTERPEAIEQSTFMVLEPKFLKKMFEEHINNFQINYECPFGDGHSAEKIMKILKQYVQ